MKILITGATGLVGREIVKQCRARDISIHYLTTSKDKIVSNSGYQGFYWNPGEGEIDLHCFEGVSAIINLAGASISKRWTSKYKKIILASRVDTLRTLYGGLKKSKDHTVSSLVSASAIGIYPNSLTHYYTEDEEGVDDSFLGEVVEAWEREADHFNDFHFKVAKIRIGLVMSDKGGALPEMSKPIKNYLGAAFGSGEQWQSWIHISDLARLFIFAVENRLQGVYNAVAPNPVSNNKLVKEIANVLKRPLFLPNIPKSIMRLALGQMSYLLFASQRVSCKKIENAGFQFGFSNVCVALRQIYGTGRAEEVSGEAYKNGYSS